MGRNLEHTTTPPSYKQPTMVVPVLVAFGSGTPLACNAALRSWFEKSRPGMSGVRGRREGEVKEFEGAGRKGSCGVLILTKMLLRDCLFWVPQRITSSDEMMRRKSCLGCLTRAARDYATGDIHVTCANAPRLS